ncbi:MAG: class I SAM-dependent RNA methyltransferase [Deltaproteobacteria bacterium]|nr:class I SAM-dependent RNA methyltransferase [Deltaproteobacteria bacterium]
MTNFKTSSPRDQQTYPLTIDSLAFGGDGLGRHQGKVIFVPGTVPGDRVLVSLTQEQKDYAFGKVDSFVEKSPLRISSPCPYEGTCGGCHWLTLPYEQQKVYKEAFVRDALQRVARQAIPPVQFFTSPSPQNYRSRVLLRGKVDQDGAIHVGFFAQASHEQVAVKQCLNASEAINGLIDYLMKQTIAASPQKFRLEVQELAWGENGQASLLVTLHALEGKKSLRSLKEAIARYDKIAWVGFHDEDAKKPFLFENDEGLEFYTCPGAFQQIHIELNKAVRQTIKRYAEEKNVKTVLDLFCGSGNLSLPLADGRRTIFGCEQSQKSVDLAQWNVEKNKLSQIKFAAECSESFLGKKVSEHFETDLLIADPPRRGMKECLEAILKLRPRYIAYLSCDPMTLARDLRTLLSHYSIESILAFDFFPNTYHVETLVLLISKDSLEGNQLRSFPSNSLPC